MTTLTQQEQQRAQDVLQLNSTDYLEFYVGNAHQASYFYRVAMGFRLVAYAGPENGQHDRVSYVLQQGNIRFVLSSPLRPDNEMAEHIRLHGDGVRDIALCVDDAKQAWKETIRRGARSVAEPHEIRDAFGTARKASIASYGDTIHTFIERKNYHGAFLPGFIDADGQLERFVENHDDHLARPTGLLHVDHVAANVGWSEMNRWVEFYADVMGFQHYDDRDPFTEHGALMANGNGRVKFLLHEPGEGQRKSQTEEYLGFHHGPGVQRIALATDDIMYTVSRLRAQGIEFLRVPHSHYAQLQSHTSRIDEPLDELERLGILVDRDDHGYMLQIFTRPVEDRPTLFFEIVQRKGIRRFGKGNFKTIFEGTELDAL